MALPPPASGSTVLVTGASSGIGAELARELARRGYDLVLAARREQRLADLAAELSAAHGVRALVEPADLADAGDRARLLDRLAGRDVVGVCNNAGFGHIGPFLQADAARQVAMVRLNVEAVVELTRALAAPMVAQGAGAILNVASIAARQPLPMMATYAATKSFVLSFSEAVHGELAGTGVSVTCVCPGPTHSEFGEKAGLGGMESRTPEAVFMEAAEVAREAISGMVAGRRTVTPGLKNKALATGGRLVPRALLLPAARRFGRAL
jgi:short-subunit dehydrogenase